VILLVMGEIAFVAKKAVSVLLHPVGIGLAFLFTGLIFWRRTRRSRLGVWFVLVASVWLLIASLPITGFLLMRPLEDVAGPCADRDNLKRLGVRDILVLGGGGPANCRVVEGIRMWRHLPKSRLILSGGRTGNDPMWKLSIELGVPEADLILRTGALDTADEARLFGETVGKAPFALVTSAYHVPRAMRLFQAMGLNPVAAPCEFRTTELPPWSTCLLPTADALLSTQLAMHEYLGMIWQVLTQGTEPVPR
jgi:uncharacterized SAM-binding protein YcdF (DUF218 family)